MSCSILWLFLFQARRALPLLPCRSFSRVRIKCAILTPTSSMPRSSTSHDSMLPLNNKRLQPLQAPPLRRPRPNNNHRPCSSLTCDDAHQRDSMQPPILSLLFVLFIVRFLVRSSLVSSSTLSHTSTFRFLNQRMSSRSILLQLAIELELSHGQFVRIALANV